MIKYYTRACNFYHGDQAKKLLKTKNVLPLCGNNRLVFDRIEIIIRKGNQTLSKFISLKEVKNLKLAEKKKNSS